ncbi:hypothetical protein V1291_002041 [Nitrobacteraceae bacterium AZCC 1564]
MLEPYLRAFSATHSAESAINLQIFELIGTTNEKRKALIRMQQLILAQSGKRAAEAFYQRSALHASLWSHLLAAAPNREAAARILNLQHMLTANISDNGRVSLDLSAIERSDYALIDPDQLIRNLEMEFGSAKDLDEVENEAQSVRDDELESYLEQILREISSAGRQEERIAIVLDEMLKDPYVGAAILRSYRRDRGQFATKVLVDLLRNLPRINFAMGSQSAWGLVMKTIQNAMRDAYPHGRGPLLYYLAKHLGKHRPIREVILEKLYSSRSFYIQQYREEILRFLVDDDKKVARSFRRRTS